MAGAPHRYPLLLVGLHWALAFLIIGMLASGLLMESELFTPMQTYQLIQWHKAFGVAVLLLVALRIVTRGWAMLTHRIPALPKSFKLWEVRAAHLGHLGLYGLMLLVPVAGWLMVSASPYGLPTVLWGNVVWPHVPLVAELKPTVYGIAHEAHELLGKALIALLVLHVAAVVKHAYLDKINLLTRVKPW